MTQTKTWQTKLSRWGLLAMVSGGFTGYSPIAPGSVGTLVGVLIVWLCWGLPIPAQIALCMVVAGIGVWTCDKATKVFKKADSPRIVIDEIAGMMVTMIGLPAEGPWLLGGYVVFRFLDIVKPEPARTLDRRIKHGWGVMGDDLVAGVYGNVLLHLVMRAAV